MIDINILTREYFGNTVQQYVIYFGIVIAFLIGAKIFDIVVKRLIAKFVSKTKNKVDDIILFSLEKSVVFLIILFGLYIASFSLILSDEIRSGYGIFLRVLLTFNLALIFSQLIESVITEYMEPLVAKTESDLDDHLLPFIRTIIKTTIVILVVIMVLADLGFNVTAIIASLGIGGLAIGLAAKDFASNLFGGLVIIMDKPFTLGDKINIAKEEGIVRNITLRYTELETDDRTKKIIPNSKFIGNPVHNISFKYKSKKKK